MNFVQFSNMSDSYAPCKEVWYWYSSVTVSWLTVSEQLSLYANIYNQSQTHLTLLTIPSALKIPAWKIMINLNNEAAAHVLLGSIILLRWRTYVIYICNNLPHGSCKHTSVCKNTNHKIDVLDILSYLHFEEIFVQFTKSIL